MTTLENTGVPLYSLGSYSLLPTEHFTGATMDETTFQQELVQLKHRVAQMASAYHTQPALQDNFAFQLEDVKTRLQSMQNSLGYLIAQRAQQHVPQHVQAPAPAEPQAQGMLPPTVNRFALPSGPLFWQLFTALRTDVRGLNNRVAALELNYADLEDRVEALEPKQFTPEASEDDTGLQQLEPDFTTLDFSFGHQPEIYCYQQDCYKHYQPTADTTNSPGQTSNVPSNVHSTSAPALEGVAFRDREIAQLEDLIRQTQEDLRRNEDLVSEKDAQIAELDKSNANRSDENYACHQEIQRLRNVVQLQEATLQTRNAQQTALQQSFLRKKTQLSQAGKHVQELERSLYDLQTSRKEAMDEMTAAKDEEIKKLRDFCEVKETLVSRQEQIIARGVKIIGERDEEIERLGRQLKVISDDHRQELRERERCSKLLNERDDHIKQLQESLAQAFIPQPRAVKAERRSMPFGRTPQPRDGESMCDRSSPFKKSTAPVNWHPQPIGQFSRLPHEQKRAASWEEPESARCRFGVPGIATPPPQQQPNQAIEGQRRDLRRSDSLKLLQRLALAEEGESMPAQNNPMTERNNRTQRQRLPLDDISRPPLPAPLPPRKTASLANLTARRDDDFGPDGQRPIARHQSIQELPRRKLQPYVEEGEQGGEE